MSNTQLKSLRIATRKSPLALWQANFVKNALESIYPKLHIELLPMITSGDKFLQGNKGLFVKELEDALLANRADIAVHSMKDVPTELPNGLEISAILKREDARDCFLSNYFSNLDELPHSARIGTISLRRQAQLLAYRPDLQMHPIRGNIQTRLLKLETQDLDAIILAKAGLNRMNLTAPYQVTLPEELMLPACGQGALGIECRSQDDTIKHLIAPLNHQLTALCVQTERMVNQGLGGNCHTPIALYCKLQNNQLLSLQAKILKPNGQKMLNYSGEQTVDQSNELAQNCLTQLLAQGAAEWLKA